MEGQDQTFGGQWTEDKLDRLEKYLKAYTVALKKKRFYKTYIDAFAGSGHYSSPLKVEKHEELFPDLAEDEVQGFRKGSAARALDVAPPFDHYIFIEWDPENCQQLEKVRQTFPNRNITVENADCNECIERICAEQWHQAHKRGVIFLDPFGMQVRWSTIQAIAKTKALDVWILFPLGVAVNRMLTRDGNIRPEWRRRLDEMFGTTEWFQRFYAPDKQTDLFDSPGLKKLAGFDDIAGYYNERLGTVFPAVAPKPLRLENSRRIPLYLLCFACSNPSRKARELALKIAEYILAR